MTDEELTVDGVELVQGDPIYFCGNGHDTIQMTARFIAVGTPEEVARPIMWVCRLCYYVRLAKGYTFGL